MRCDDADALIDAFAEGALDDDAALREHVAACARCTEALARSRRLTASLATLRSVSPSAAADARVLAAVEEERRWARARASIRRRLLGAGAVAAAAALVAALCVTPVTERVVGVMPALAETAAAWLRFRVARSLEEVRGPLVGVLALLVAVAVIERVAARTARRATT
jgi:anti-sigma factor RsiW